MSIARGAWMGWAVPVLVAIFAWILICGGSRSQAQAAEGDPSPGLSPAPEDFPDGFASRCGRPHVLLLWWDGRSAGAVSW
jgi:hypothetical protein